MAEDAPRLPPADPLHTSTITAVTAWLLSKPDGLRRCFVAVTRTESELIHKTCQLLSTRGDYQPDNFDMLGEKTHKIDPYPTVWR